MLWLITFVNITTGVKEYIHHQSTDLKCYVICHWSRYILDLKSSFNWICQSNTLSTFLHNLNLSEWRWIFFLLCLPHFVVRDRNRRLRIIWYYVKRRKTRKHSIPSRLASVAKISNFGKICALDWARPQFSSGFWKAHEYRLRKQSLWQKRKLVIQPITNPSSPAWSLNESKRSLNGSWLAGSNTEQDQIAI